MKDAITDFLRLHGPSLSSGITRHLTAQGMSSETARQRISRSGSELERLKGINFPNRESFLFLKDQFGTEPFKASLSRAFESTNSSYGRALIGLRARGGYVAASSFAAATGLPIMPTKGLVLHDSVKAKLEQLGMIRSSIIEDEEFISSWDFDGTMAHRNAVMIAEEWLLAAVKTWLIKTGWSSTNVLSIRNKDKTPQYGQFAWDMVGPCFLSGMTTSSKEGPKPGFLVGDIILDRQVSNTDLRPLLAKWDSLISQKRSARMQVVVIAEVFAADALHELRKRGVLIAHPTTLFGEEIASDLKQLIRTIENAAAAVVTKPQEVFRLMSKIMKIEGAALNLRGVVIEMIIAHLYKLKGYNIDIRQQAFGQDGKAEIDVKAASRSEVVCCECKGKSPHVLVNVSEIQDWVDRSLPRIKHWLKQFPSLPTNKRFEFWSSSSYTKEAWDLIGRLESKHTKQPIKFFAGEEVIKQLQKQNETALVDIFNEQFAPPRQSRP